MKEMNNEITVVNNLQAGALIQNRYNYRIEQFFRSAKRYVQGVYLLKGLSPNGINPVDSMRDNWVNLRAQTNTNIIGDIKTVYFVMPDTPNDLSVWAAYKDATDKVMAYYARDARYDLKNQDVKEALDNWFSVIKKPSKQTEPLVKAWEEKEKQERDRNLAMSKMTSKSM